ncbi:MAG: 30S ribosome-binding factor RbfA [Gammaproteobacteria bacterium]|nr:30S ribosome-binding factor RbfA [Gammaproteobacteria bacterium]MDH5735464.1 30S ribosome-binding factor RbfA [Gammaproteobacteria bacterium]
MPKEFSRSQRMAEQIRRELSELIRNEIKDPRVSWVSITAVKCSKDLTSAIVYFTLMDNSNSDQTLQTLNNAAGFLRKQLASRIRSRITPVLKFIYDNSIERGSEMDALIAKARSTDADVDSE